MNASMKYPRLQELANNIQLQMERLKAGELSLEELEIVAEQSRELYERLVVLRYKAFHETVQEKTESDSPVPTIEEVKPEPTAQVSLTRTMGQQGTLVQQHTHAPIADHKIAITLNQRFQFSRELFKGNNQEYEVAIDQLNTSSRDEAMSQLTTLESKYEWNSSSTVVRDFRLLVERRHQ